MNSGTPTPRSNHTVMLPCSPEQFSNFIGGLLGKPQTITQALRGSFEVSANDLLNIHHLIHQRITQQNGGELIQFTARIIFNDDSSVLINDLHDLLNYNEVRPVVSEQIHLSWLYIIKFSDKEFPEKQTIDLSFLAKGGEISIDELAFHPGWMSKRAGSVEFRIQHTARTWGADIQSLLESHLQNLLTPEGFIKQFSRKHNTKIQSLTFSLIIAFAITSVLMASRQLHERLILKIAELGSLTTEKKIDAIIESVHLDPWNSFSLYSGIYLLSSVFIAILVLMWMDLSLTRSKPSFVLLTPMSERYKKTKIDRYNFQWRAFFGSSIASIITGVISAIIYANYWGA